MLDIETTSLSPAYGRITCICAKDSDGERFEMVEEDESLLIDNFIDWMKPRNRFGFFLITKNGKQFDIPWLLLRESLIMGYYPDDDEVALHKYQHFDLQEITSRRISLQSMAELLNCAPKSGTGKNAIKLWNERSYDELRDYCMQDVETTEEVFLKWRELHNGGGN